MLVQDLVRLLPADLGRALSRVLTKVPLEVRYGRVFRETRRRLRESEAWSAAEIEAYQAQELRALVLHAYENVPYYRRVLTQRGLTPGDIASAADLAKLPLLDKECIRANQAELIARNVPSSRIYRGTTGGTTGLPMYVYGEKGVGTAREWAYVWRAWNWAGHRYGERRAMLRAERPNSGGRRAARPWGLDPVNNVFVASALDLTPDTLPTIAARIRDLEVVCLQAYPSALHVLTEWLRSHGETIPSLRRCLTSSETLLPKQREQVESVLGVPIFDHYGNSERSVLITQCERQTYHVIPEYGIVELLDEEGRPVEEEGQRGEIVATGFTNRVMPLLRHRTGDFAVKTRAACSCGRDFPAVAGLLGRRQDYFVGRDGALLSSLWCDEPIWTCRGKIRAYQYVQDEPGRVVLNLEPREELTVAEMSTVRRRFREVFPRLDVEIAFVERIERTSRGKFRYVVQNLPVVPASVANDLR